MNMHKIDLNNNQIDNKNNDTNRSHKRIKWKFLEHKGPIFSPPFKSLPPENRLIYNGEAIELNPEAEEVAVLYAKELNNSCIKNVQFRENFFKDWKDLMTDHEKNLIQSLNECDFTKIKEYIDQRIDKEEKQQIKEEFGFCNIDGVRAEIKDFVIQLPALFKGQGKNKNIGKIKRRIRTEDVTINCSEDSKFPEPMEGKWKVVHDGSVMWLAKWTDPISKKTKYITLKLNQDDKHKYEKAKELHSQIHNIRRKYREDMLSNKELAVALYLIDRLGIRIGSKTNKDTTGCCSLRVSNIKCHENVIVFDFVGKHSVRYFNEVEVDPTVFEILGEFQKDRTKTDYLFPNLNANQLNSYLDKQMAGLTAKVFRTYKASCFFEILLNLFSKYCIGATIEDTKRVRSYKKCYKCANAAVAIFLNHWKTSEVTSEADDNQIKEANKEVDKCMQTIDMLIENSDGVGSTVEKLYKRLETLLLSKLLNLFTSRSNYLDPRITVAWCIQNEIEIVKVFTKAQRERFFWAIRTKDRHFRFCEEKGNASE